LDVKYEDSPKLSSSYNFTNINELRIDTVSKENSKWFNLGIKTDVSPSIMMSRIYNALKKLKLEWRVLGEFYIQCRTSDHKSIVNIQVFRVDTQSYNLDVQRGNKCDIFMFMDLVNSFKKALIN
jgi:hypothetical protein